MRSASYFSLVSVVVLQFLLRELARLAYKGQNQKLAVTKRITYLADFATRSANCSRCLRSYRRRRRFCARRVRSLISSLRRCVQARE